LRKIKISNPKLKSLDITTFSKTSPDRTYEFYKIVATNKGNLAGRYYKMDTKMNAKYLKRKHNIIRGIK